MPDNLQMRLLSRAIVPANFESHKAFVLGSQTGTPPAHFQARNAAIHQLIRENMANRPSDTSRGSN
ncbi:MAG: hypothetical protein DMG96_27805 [Acidobacteria bacterium]|nr:MAG: hypothetical protein DMG98_27915 [Acidobacteriota bacterium]PYV71882.1 MAG: hypothetical protein DMG96_27805 [Acidobacteriota bacterium]